MSDPLDGGSSAAMQDLSASGIEPSWFDYPIVALAQRQASGDPLRTLENLSSLLAHVEAKCPTVDYTTLFESHHLDGLDAALLADQYRKLGVTEDVDETIFEDLFPDVDVSATAVTDMMRAHAKDLRRSNWKLAEIGKVLGRSTSGVHVLLKGKVRQPKKGITAEERRVGEFRPDLSQADAARLLGLHRQRVHQCRKLIERERAAQ